MVEAARHLGRIDLGAGFGGVVDQPGRSVQSHDRMVVSAPDISLVVLTAEFPLSTAMVTAFSSRNPSISMTEVPSI